MDGTILEGYAGDNMTTGSVREGGGTGHALVDDNVYPAIGGGVAVESYSFDSSDNVLGVFDGNGGSLPSSVLGLRYLFQGREYSWAIHAAWGGAGLYYFRARYYDPSTGRWLSNDPIGISGGLNQYAFCANNPVMFVDPEGRLFTTLRRFINHLRELRARRKCLESNRKARRDRIASGGLVDLDNPPPDIDDIQETQNALLKGLKVLVGVPADLLFSGAHLGPPSVVGEVTDALGPSTEDVIDSRSRRDQKNNESYRDDDGTWHLKNLDEE
jgi:RHS repeat-associated protein